MALKNLPSALSETLRKLKDSLERGERFLKITGLKGSASAFFISVLRNLLQHPLIIITPETEKAEELYQDLCFYLAPEVDRVFYLPPRESVPWEQFSSPPSISAQRIEGLYNLLVKDSFIAIIPQQCLLQKVLPAETLREFAITIKKGSEIERDLLIQRLIEGGYLRSSLVEGLGEFAVRGGVLDIFSPGHKKPVRVEFFSDQIESLRVFDPSSQRSIKEMDELTILPVREIVLKEGELLFAKKRVELRWSELGFAQEDREGFMEKTFLPPYLYGSELWIPYFYQELDTLFTYFPLDTLYLLYEPFEIQDKMERFLSEVEKGFDNLLSKSIPVPEIALLYISKEEALASIEVHPQIHFEQVPYGGDQDESIVFNTETNEDLRKKVITDKSPHGGFSSLMETLNGWLETGNQIFLISSTVLEAKKIAGFLEDYDFRIILSEEPFASIYQSFQEYPLVTILAGDLSKGFRFPALKLIILTEEEIFGEKRKVRITPRLSAHLSSDFSDLEINDYMVHVDYGIGIYRGVKKIKVEDFFQEYLTLEYQDGDRLYIPMERLNLLHKYKGAEGYQPKLDRLGDASWKRRKKRTQQSLKELAEELLNLYAVRKVVEGFSFTPPDHYYREFENTFPYEETPDQLRAIEEVIQDMMQNRPMDRLICGDVGYGKTEVALRASFKAALDGKQTAILVPTTILAQQHYQTFSARLKDYPVTVEVLSRFKSRHEQKQILKGVKEGSIDIVIGTHRLLQRDIEFKDLGLLIIDEEQRFGVVHKEKLKKLRQQVDVLSLTATPIPRTLYMSMVGLRDISIINTPPPDRLSIKTYIVRFDEEVIREAIIREISRGGQVFFVHDRVESISGMAEFLRRLVPEAKLGIAHGQMKERDLERVMLAFLRKEINLLLCTTIIESGMDFPQANTILINRADKMGLAQLYQLRGRVGRSHYLAYAYFLIPGDTLLSEEAKKRLAALVEFSELGSGLRLATRDLEIRGAGNLLGKSQSGHISAVGLDLYIELLENAIRELKGEEIPLEIEPEINLPIPAYIPEEYIGDIHQRLVLYKRLASLKDDDELSRIEEELKDRFGPLPETVHNLLEIVSLKNLLKRSGVTKLEFNSHKIILTFNEKVFSAQKRLMTLSKKESQRYHFTPERRLKISFPEKDWRKIIKEVKKVLQY